MNTKLLIAFGILDLTILYQFTIWLANAMKNIGWFNGLTIPIVIFGTLIFVLANLLIIKESLKDYQPKTKEILEWANSYVHSVVKGAKRQMSSQVIRDCFCGLFDRKCLNHKHKLVEVSQKEYYDPQGNYWLKCTIRGCKHMEIAPYWASNPKRGSYVHSVVNHTNPNQTLYPAKIVMIDRWGSRETNDKTCWL